jgi:hypothetical protein
VNATTTQKIIAAAIVGVFWLLAIVAIHFYPDVKEPLLAFTLTCSGLITLIAGAHLASSSAAPAAPPVAPAQGGYFGGLPYLAVLVPIALLAALFLPGCTTTTASMYSGLYTQAKAGVQVFDDNSLKTMKDILCAQPYSAIQRHPEMQAGVVVLCGPLANTATLNAEQLALLAGLYKQLGLQPTAVALPPAAK